MQGQYDESEKNKIEVPTIEGNSIGDNEYESKSECSTKIGKGEIVRRLSKVGNMNSTEIRRLTGLNQIDREKEIEDLKQEVKQYQYLMAMIAINSAWFSSVFNVIIYYDKNVLELSGAENARIRSLVTIPFSLKPIFGCLSDSFYIFGYR